MDLANIALGTKGHEELMLQFEVAYPSERLDRESKELWPKGIIYCDGQVNKLFLAFRKGVAYGLLFAR